MSWNNIGLYLTLAFSDHNCPLGREAISDVQQHENVTALCAQEYSARERQLDRSPIGEHSMTDKPARRGAVVKATVQLRRDQVVRLDRLAIDIRASNGTVVTRAEIIRACIEVVLDLELDVGQVFGEQDLIDLIHQRIGL
jgi:hypothetical protein